MPTIAQPSLSLPQGGGALKGLGGEVSSGAFDGSAGFSLPLPLSPGRGAPTLSLSYSSNAGNGAFGMGMAVELPKVSRLTTRGVPRYAGSDAFSLSGVGALTPALQRRPGGGWAAVEREEVRDGTTFRVRTFRPRLEGARPLIERWEGAGDGVAHWLLVDGANTTSRFGSGEASRVADPDDPSRAAEWLLDETADARGNRTLYEYVGEGAQRYPAAVRYGNYSSGDGERFALELVFDYGERHLDDLGEPGADPYAPARPWAQRADPFSSFAYGFELRTARLCRALLMFHRFAELGDAPCLVASLRLGYGEQPTVSRIETIVHGGHRRRPDGSYLSRDLPPLTLGWSSWEPGPTPRFDPLLIGGEDPPSASVGTDLQPIDLDGEGLPGLLRSAGTATYYCRPLGGGAYAPPTTLPRFPSGADLRDSRLSLEDLDGDGRLELVVNTAAASGYFGRGEEGDWQPFEPFSRTPTPLRGQRGELVDLDGNGRSDLMLVEKETVRVYASAGLAGFGGPSVSRRAPGFPAAGRQQRQLVTFANVFGDGLAHRVRVADGEVEVWPSLGHGRFGAPRLLRDAPAFAATAVPDRIFFADLDCSGTADLVFAYADRLELHRNQAGNGFAPALTVPLPVELDELGRIAFADVLGTGTTAVVLTAAEPEARSWFCDLCAGARPQLLTGLDDGAGVVVEIAYAPSSRFYLEDMQAGDPWTTRLPFPVQVVERVLTTDAPAGTRSVRRNRYRDGWFDPAERQFRGFGFVETWDAETFEERAAAGRRAGEAEPRAVLHGTPARTRSWFAVGSIEQSEALRAARRREQFGGDPDAYPMPASVLDRAAHEAGERTLSQAHAALTGQMLRSELYGEDGTAAAAVPYAVTDSNYAIGTLQPALDGAPGCFHVRPRETLKLDYERDPADPRTTHEFGLELTLYDEDGETSYLERSCAIAYPRRSGAPGPGRVPEQERTRAHLSEGRQARVLAPFRQIGAACEERTLELGGISVPAGAYLGYEEAHCLAGEALAAPIPYGSPFSGDRPQSRPCAWSRTIYWDEEQSAPLPPGRIGSRALPHHVERAAFPASWLQATFGDRVGEADLLAAGFRYEEASSTWWAPGLVEVQHGPSEPEMHFATRETASPAALADGDPGPFSRTTVTLDSPYALQPTAIEAYVDPGTKLPTAAEIDYASLQPWQLTDPNGIVHQALLDPLGFLLATSVFKPAEGEDPRSGDGDLREYALQPEPSLEEVLERPLDYLQQASSYHFTQLAPWQPGEPARATIELERPRFLSRGPVTASELRTRIAYRDGSGRELVTLTACDPSEADGESDARWIVGPRVTYDNKGRPVEERLPAYTATPAPPPPGPPETEGSEPPPRTTHYDALGRPHWIETPKGFFSKVERSAWEERSYDADDTVLDSRFYREFMGGYPPHPSPAQEAEREALEKAAGAYDTPTATVFDNAGNAVREIRDNLGNVTAERFAEIVRGTPISAEELWQQLIAKGYLSRRDGPQPGARLGARFDPYSRGFVLELDPPFQRFAAAVADLLLQGRLTELHERDGEGRTTRTADPRLFLAEVRSGARHSNFSYRYAMEASEPALTESADAGARRILAGALGEVLSSWDARELRSDHSFDGLRRPLTLTVGDASATRLRERIAYGEGQPRAASRNLLGRPYRVEDGAGTLTTPEYEIDGHPRSATRQFAADWRTEPDWSGSVRLDPAAYTTRLVRDSFGEPASETTADGSTTSWSRHRSRRLAAIAVEPPGGDTAVSVLASAAYAAAGQRTTSVLGNGAVQRDTLEQTTQRVLRREAAAADGTGLQRIAYAYDPVGNVTSAEDGTAALAFATPQPTARGDYRYDPLYRLRSATGLQAPGLGAETYATGFKQTVFAPLAGGPRTPAVTLESFAETYSYDASGNLIELGHQAASGSYSRQLPVLADSNRLAGVPCDAAGNSLQIQLEETVALAWDDRGALASASAPGTDTANSYDGAGERARRVVEANGVAGERRYLGGCLVDLSAAGGDGDPVFTLRVGDGAATVATLSGPELRFELDDRLGSVALQTDGAGRVVSYEGFLPYGGSAVIAAADEAAVAGKTFRYSGKECDDSTALSYYGARFAASWQGRWLCPDPSGPVEGLNLYAFVGGSPLTKVDPDGRNGGDPNKKPGGFLEAFAGSFASAFYLGTDVMRKVRTGIPTLIYGPRATPQEKAALAAEVGHTSREMLIALERRTGYSILPQLSSVAAIRGFLYPGSPPLSMRPIPFYGESVAQWYLRRNWESISPAVAGNIAGSFTASFLTVGTAFSLGFEVALGKPTLRGALGRVAVAGPASLAISAATVYAEMLTRYRDRGWVPSWRQLAGQLAGVPRIATYTEGVAGQAQQTPSGADLVGLGIILLTLRVGPTMALRSFRSYLAATQSSAARAGAQAGQAGGAAATAPSRALVPYREPNSALIAYQPPANALAARK